MPRSMGRNYKYFLSLLALATAGILFMGLARPSVVFTREINQEASFSDETPESSHPLEASSPIETSSPSAEPAEHDTKEKSHDEHHIPTSCECSHYRFSSAATYEQQLDLGISWLNLSTWEVLEKQHPNFPLALLSNHDEKWCDLMPQPHAISWNNIYYQSLQVDDTAFLLYSAFFDNRENTDLRPCVRVLAYTRSVEPATPWCYVWFNSSGPPIVTRVARMEYVDWLGRSETRQMTYLMTCRIPQPEGGATSPVVPLAVSLVPRPCEKAVTLLQVTGAAERNASTALTKQENGAPLWNLAVCGPSLFYYHEDFSLRMVEWLELLRAQGVSKVLLSLTDVHPNLLKVLLYYEAEGFVKLVRFSYPEPYVNEPNIRRLWFLLEKIKTFALQKMYFTDCVLRHMHEYRFIAHFDPDEVPMLLRHDSLPLWLDAQLERVKGNNKLQPATYKLAWYYHNSDLKPPPSTASLPKYLWAMRHTRRSNKYFKLTPGMFKPVFDMDLATGVFSHDVVTCASGRCQRRSSSCPRSEAYLGHYNYDCGDFCRTPNSTTEEPVLLRYKDQVLPAVAKVLRELQLL